MTDQSNVNTISSNIKAATNTNNDNLRQSESPARTIDSHDSTTGSMNTIVDRNFNHAEMLHATIEQSTNANNNSNDSLTNSQASMLRRNSSDGNATSVPSMQQQQNHHNNQQQQQSDTQSHIYSSPVYDQKPPLKLTAISITDLEKDIEKPKLITHAEFQKQLEQAVALRANAVDSRISKKQRFPPELIKIKDTDATSLHSSKSKSNLNLQTSTRSSIKPKISKASTACCSTFPLQIILGTLQLMLAISMVALGSLLIVREAPWTTAGSGLGTGLIAAITGSLGVISIRKTQTAFLALSLVCIATSTLAMAIAGAGLSRDVNRMDQEFELMNTNEEISAVCGLLFALFLHFIVSIISVYRCAMQICAKSENAELNDVIIKTKRNSLLLDQEKVDRYIKEFSTAGNDKENQERLAAMWLYAAQLANMPPASVRKLDTVPSRPIMLIPAKTGNPTLLPVPSSRPPSVILSPGLPYHGMPMPYVHPAAPILYPLHGSIAGSVPGSVPGTFRTQRSSKSANIPLRQRRRLAQMPRFGRMEANRRQRRKSEADVVDAPSYEYHGLDRAIADSFLERQELSNAGSHVDYSSSSTASDSYGQRVASRASSKTKIICRDVEM